MMISMFLTYPSNDVVVFKPKSLVNWMVTDLLIGIYVYKINLCPSIGSGGRYIETRKMLFIR